MNRELNVAEVWELVRQGCNAAEIAAYAGVSLAAAQAMVARAVRDHAGIVPRETLRTAA